MANGVRSVAFTFAEALVLAPAFILSKILPNEPDEIVKADGTDIAIVLVHGKGANKNQFLFLKRYLVKEKFGTEHIFPVFSVNLLRNDESDVDYTVESLAKNLKNHIQQMKAKGFKRFIFIGHSLGGVVGAYFKHNLARALDVEVIMLIAMGVPFYGISPLVPKLIRYSCGILKNDKCVEQLLPNSKILLNLQNAIQEDETIFYIMGKYDAVVSAELSAFAPERLFVYNHSHYAFNVKRSIFQKIAQLIENQLQLIL